jgi:hypothetical protein
MRTRNSIFKKLVESCTFIDTGVVTHYSISVIRTFIGNFSRKQP